VGIDGQTIARALEPLIGVAEQFVGRDLFDPAPSKVAIAALSNIIIAEPP